MKHRTTARAGARPAGATVSDAQYRRLARFRYALRQFLRFSEDAARAAGLTPQQHQTLLAVRGFPGDGGMTISELAERLQIRHHSAVGLIDRLVAQDFMRRRTSDRDRRQVRLSLTRRGTRILDRLTLAHTEELRRLGPVIADLLTQLHQTS